MLEHVYVHIHIYTWILLLQHFSVHSFWFISWMRRHKPHFIFRLKLILHEHAQHKTIHNWRRFIFLYRFIFHSWRLLFINLQLYMCLSHHTILYELKLLTFKITGGSGCFSVRQRLFNTRIHFVSITSYF